MTIYGGIDCGTNSLYSDPSSPLRQHTIGSNATNIPIQPPNASLFRHISVEILFAWIWSDQDSVKWVWIGSQRKLQARIFWAPLRSFIRIFLLGFYVLICFDDRHFSRFFPPLLNDLHFSLCRFPNSHMYMCWFTLSFIVLSIVLALNSLILTPLFLASHLPHLACLIQNPSVADVPFFDWINSRPRFRRRAEVTDQCTIAKFAGYSKISTIV